MVRKYINKKIYLYIMEKTLKKIGLTDNEIKIYIHLLKFGEQSAYKIGQETGIYRVHVYDKIKQLIQKSLVSYVSKGKKKYYRAAHPSKILDFLEEKSKIIESEKNEVIDILPNLNSLMYLPKVDTKVEIFEGKEGIKYILKDIIKEARNVSITGIDDERYEDELPIFMKQYFRDVKLKGIKERVITSKKRGVFLFKKDLAPNTSYKFLEEDQFNPTNTFIYGNKVVIITWGTPITAILIQNEDIAKTYQNNFEHLWNNASLKPN